MAPEIIVTIITGAGVILTVIVSSFFNWKKVNVELNSLKQQNQLTYATQLLEKRHELYPALYNTIIQFINSVRAKDIKRENLIELYHELTAWDQTNSIFLSARSQFRFFELLKSIRTIVNEGKGHPTWSERQKILENIRKVELALKSDLGVFVVEFSGAPEGFFDDYTSLFEETQKEEMKPLTPEEEEEIEEQEEEEIVGEREEGVIDE